MLIAGNHDQAQASSQDFKDGREGDKDAIWDGLKPD